MGQALFYHLTRSPLEATLPMLLGRSLQAGWHVVVRGTDREYLEWLDAKLWLGGDEAFLPHGLAGGEHDADQPILLTTDAAMPNGAACLMSVGGGEVTPEECTRMERVCVLFDGNDPTAVETARGQWKRLTEAGQAAQYWSEESGRWKMMAERAASAP